MTTVLEVAFWACAGLVLWTQLAYPLALLVVQALLRKPGPPPPLEGEDVPLATVVVAAYKEANVIERRVENLRDLDWPADRLEIIVACDGSDELTVEAARNSGADQVLQLPRGGKISAQDAGVRAAAGDLLAFSDANAIWDRGALRYLLAPFADPRVAYTCGRVRFGGDGSNQEDVYWRFEMAVRGLESRLYSVTAGNGAIYAVRRGSYIELDPVLDHDLMFPFTFVKQGSRAVDAPGATASELMVPSIEGEFARKRRMMSFIWAIVMTGGMLSPRGYPLGYAAMIFSHRVLRYASPALHLVAFAASGLLAPTSIFWTLVFGLQVLILAAALIGSRVKFKPILICRYYVFMTAAIAAGWWDWYRKGVTAGWEPPEGTR